MHLKYHNLMNKVWIKSNKKKDTTQSEWKTQFAPDSGKVKMGFSEVKVSDVLTETLVEEASARCDDWLATDEFVNDVWLWFFFNDYQGWEGVGKKVIAMTTQRHNN